MSQAHGILDVSRCVVLHDTPKDEELKYVQRLEGIAIPLFIDDARTMDVLVDLVVRS